MDVVKEGHFFISYDFVSHSMNRGEQMERRNKITYNMETLKSQSHRKINDVRVRKGVWEWKQKNNLLYFAQEFKFSKKSKFLSAIKAQANICQKIFLITITSPLNCQPNRKHLAHYVQP